MPTFFRKTSFALLIGSLTACASPEITLRSVAGIYGCDLCLSGSTLYLRPNGTFWLALGDEFAAELKMLAQEIGFSCRSWVIWY